MDRSECTRVYFPICYLLQKTTTKKRHESKEVVDKSQTDNLYTQLLLSSISILVGSQLLLLSSLYLLLRQTKKTDNFQMNSIFLDLVNKRRIG